MKWRVVFTVDYGCIRHIDEDMKRIHDPPSVVLKRVEIENVKDEVPARKT